MENTTNHASILTAREKGKSRNCQQILEKRVLGTEERGEERKEAALRTQHDCHMCIADIAGIVYTSVVRSGASRVRLFSRRPARPSHAGCERLGRPRPLASPPRGRPLPAAAAPRIAPSTRRGCGGESRRLQICPGGTAATSQPVIAKQTRLKYWDWSQS